MSNNTLDALARLLADFHRTGTIKSREAAREALNSLPPGSLDAAEQRKIEDALAALPDPPAPPDDEWPPRPI